MKQIDGIAEAADTISRFVLPTSVTIAPGERYGGNSTSRATFASTGAARTTTSAPVTLAVLSRASIDTISTRGHLRAAALAIDPPIRPTPTMAIRRTERLDPPTPARDGFQTDAAPDRRGDDPQFGHQALEVLREHRLRTVAERVIRIAMDFDDQSMGPRRHGGARHRCDLVTPSRAMARVDNDRQVAELLDDGDCRDVQRVAREALEG